MYHNILVTLAPDYERHAAISMKAARTLLSPGGKITILTVLETIPSYVAQYLPPDHLDTDRDEITRTLATEFVDQEDVTTQVLSGNAANTILETAEANQHDCIIIASHRPGFQDYFLGSTAARVVRHAQCGVHILR